MILPIVLFSAIGLLFIVLGTMIGRQSKTGNRDANRLFVDLMRFFGIVILIVGNTYAVINSKGWTTENSKSFYLIALLVPCIVFALLGIRFLRQNSLGIVRIGAILWSFLWLGIGGYGYMQIENSGQGWTPESQQKILNKVTEYDRWCYLQQIMKMYDTPEEYNKMAVKEEEKIAAKMEEFCRTCDMGEAEEVEGLPDDF
jgi:hypothetical protein